MPFTKSTTPTTKILSDTSSTHSTVSTATTLKPTDSKKSKWFSLSKPTDHHHNPRSSDSAAAKKAIHNEAIASYLSLR
ncbi:uncharacterized protein N7469_002403 [Penicillium citrinum]|uniref:Uncharacterized protein n=2 Tax=Penicillium TaxID=5073 RepID=A0A9W9PAH6_PENCI|nr:uncharacterized protein N7469_002403 [Penicillium citrinum]KAJ5240812.1 hypothetical protein N7469_002403 [Penicillium citrinum]KAJ5585802.1 hypothetical protein N7450_005589 [Penicillium hetheringtonii]KAK5789749.1 hypothetical protein VI817_008872 [Penicillium citrinum]